MYLKGLESFARGQKGGVYIKKSWKVEKVILYCKTYCLGAYWLKRGFWIDKAVWEVEKGDFGSWKMFEGLQRGYWNKKIVWGVGKGIFDWKNGPRSWKGDFKFKKTFWGVRKNNLDYQRRGREKKRRLFIEKVVWEFEKGLER